MASLFSFLQAIEKHAPTEMALPKDNPGVQVGILNPDRQRQMRIKNVAFSVAPSAASIVRAVQQKAQVLVSHIPLFTHAIKRLSDHVLNRVRLAVKENLTIYTVSTNWIGVENGVAESTSNLLGLRIDRLFTCDIEGKTYPLGRCCAPKRSITLEILARLIAERFQQKHIEYKGRPTGVITSVLILPFDSPHDEWLVQASHQQVDTLICGTLSLEQQVLVHELHMNLIQIPRQATASLGIRRLLQLLQIELSELNMFIVGEEWTKPIFLL
ncbi:MAG: Nif3-like dinuclear metal center hexameric protein [Candidatus Ranarchaeia archaeon]